MGGVHRAGEEPHPPPWDEPSRYGKTTMLKMATGLQPWDTGKITIDGTPVRGLGPDRLTQDIVTACETLDLKGGAHPVERKQAKTGTGY